MHIPLHEILQWDVDEIDLQLAYDHEFPPFEPWHAYSVLAAQQNNQLRGQATPEDYNPLAIKERARKLAKSTPIDDLAYLKARWGPGKKGEV